MASVSLLEGAVYADSGHWQDIQNAVDEAELRGIKNVMIPEGDFNFVNIDEAWHTVLVPAGINVFGAGCITTNFDETNQVSNWLTILRMPYSVGAVGADPAARWFHVIGTEDPNKPTRMSGFAMVGFRYIDNSDPKLYEAIRFTSVIDFRADHLLLQDIAGNGIVIANDKLPNVLGCGVVDHCKLTNTDGFPAPYETRTLGYGVYFRLSWSSDFWDDNRVALIGKYTQRTVFVEDCYFQRWRHCMASNQAVHYVFRYNTIKHDWGYNSIDAHGQENAANTATMAVEIYGNTILDPIMPRQYTQSGMGIRGGCGVIFNNTVDGNYYGIQLLYEAIDDKYALRNMYVWNNTITGATQDYNFAGGLVENEHYFLYALPGYEPYPYPHPNTLEEEPPATTPFIEELEEGDYEISLSSIIIDGSNTYNFKQWEDGSTSPTRTISLTSDMSLLATYELATPETATLKGIVKDAETGQLLADATVIANGTSTKTLQDGSYEIAGLEPKQYTVTISKLGYSSQMVNVDASAGGTINIPDVELASTPIVSSVGPLMIGAMLIIGSTQL